MNFVQKTLIGMLATVILAGGVLATETFTRVDTPMDHYSMPSELDEVYTDSLVYHNFTGSYYYPSAATNFSAGVRFTPPVDFQLQGIRFYADTSTLMTTVEARVYTNNNGQPGTLLYTFDAAPSAISSDWVELTLAEEDYLDFETGSDFWIVIGGIPGAAASDWSCVLDQDGAVPGDRSKWSTTGSWTNLSEIAPFDWVINACGAYDGTFYDISVVSLYNDSLAFHYANGTEVTFSADVRNTGITASPEGTVVFSVEDDEGTEVWTSSTTIGVMGGSAVDTLTVTATESWTPDTDGRYIAYVNVTGDENEGSLENNVYPLLQEIQPVGEWMAYDDGTFETPVSNQPGNGWAVPFYPQSYPARIDSMQWFFNTDADATDLRVMIFTSEGLFEVWTYTGAVTQGWNTFEINDEAMPNGINIADGMFIGIYVMTGDLSFMSDNNPPTSAANPGMPDASFSYQDGSIYLDDSGNWGIRGLIVAGSAPAEPILAFPTIMNFGEAVVGEELVATLDIENTGDLFGIIESITVGGSVDDQVRVISAMPFQIDAESTGQIELGWTPTAEGAMPTAGLLVYHNDTDDNASPKVVPITGNASSSAVGDNFSDLPKAYSLAQNHPNPFNPTTEIRFGLPQAGNVKLTLYNVMGQRVATLLNGEMTAGFHNLTVNGANLSSGIYFYSLDVNGFHSMKKMVLMK
ncbi:T9SS type A sorting domain-containing protein [bacterium]|nr:T9SS type A sorting domain-containing protein [bacterium]